MAIVDLKSNLSQILPFKQEQQRILQQVRDREAGVDYFPNINMTGFSINRGNVGLETEYKLNDNGGPIIPQTSYLDIKGDFVSMFSPINPAYPNVYNLGVDSTPIQDFPIPTNNAVDRNGAFLPPYNLTNQYLGIGTGTLFGVTDAGGFGGAAITAFNTGILTSGAPSTANTTAQGPSVESFKSKLLQLHNQGRTINTGFTRNALSLGEFYAQQPDNFRDIGQRWGVDRIELANVPPFVETALEIFSSIASPAIGRDVPTFINRYKADVNRLLPFTFPTSTFFLKQTALHRQNPYDRIATSLYGLNPPELQSGESIFSQLATEAANSGLLDINPQVHNPLSIFSTPAYGGMMFNKNGRNFGDVASLANEAIGIAANFSLKALQYAAPQAVKLISKGLGGLAGAVGAGLGAVGGALGGVLGSIPVQKETRTNFALGTSVTKTVKTLGQFASEVAGSSFGIGVQGVLMDAGSLARRGISAGKNIVETSKAITQEVGRVSKHQASKLDPRAFEDVKVDRVNLIPYGSTKYKEDEYTALDLIPFKFEDCHTNTPIVFRAILSGITDTFSPEYSPTRFVGRPDNVYTYQGTNRSISFTFDVYPKSDTELVTLWEKLNYLAGMTYPHLDDSGTGMIAPFSKLTIGTMYDNAPGYISTLSYTIQDNTTWEVDFAKLPKYVKVQCTFVYIGNRLPTATQKHFDCPWIAEEAYDENKSFLMRNATHLLKNNMVANQELPKKANLKDVLGFAGL